MGNHQLCRHPLTNVDVFVDDFCGFGQDLATYPLALQRRAVLHNIGGIFRPNLPSDLLYRKEPLSVKKLNQEDAAFQDLKRCLGWDHGTTSKTLRRAPHRESKALVALRNALPRTRVGLKSWQSLIGQLRSLVNGLPGALGQFSLLQAALQDGHCGRVRVRVCPTVREQLATFVDLLSDPRPTPLETLVPGNPIHLGACDTAKSGMGGIWFAHDGAPLLWRAPFPPTIQRRLVSHWNPRGDITNSDLKLAGTIAHQAVLGVHQPVIGESCHTFCDNTPAVSWRQKGSATTTKATAYIFRFAALLTCKQGCYFSIAHLAGNDNRMADNASCLWALNDHTFLTYFNSTYPQARPWQLCPIPPALLLKLTSALSLQTSDAGSAPNGPLPPTPPGLNGNNFAPMSRSPATYTASPSPSHGSWSSSNAGTTAACHPQGNQSWLAQQKTAPVR